LSSGQKPGGAYNGFFLDIEYRFLFTRIASVKYTDIIGKTLNGITVQEIKSKDLNGNWICLCKCHCGNMFSTTYGHLTSKKCPKKSCGCIARKYPFLDLTNKRFGRLVAIERINSETVDSVWKCKCDCGNYKDVILHHLNGPKRSRVRSCGCLSKDFKSWEFTTRRKRVFEFNGYRFRSGYEYIYARFLSRSKIKWEYEPKTFLISGRGYTPDFYLPDTDEWVEVKGFWFPGAFEKCSKFKTELNLKLRFILEDDILKIKPNYYDWLKSIPIG